MTIVVAYYGKNLLKMKRERKSIRGKSMGGLIILSELGIIIKSISIHAICRQGKQRPQPEKLRKGEFRDHVRQM